MTALSQGELSATKHSCDCDGAWGEEMRNGKHWLRITRMLMLLLGIALLPHIVRAQTASINGTVTDPSGAVVPGATITVVNEATNATREVQSSESGTYSLSSLTPGKYDVTVAKDGLKTMQFTAVNLTVDQALTLDAKLEISGAAQTVTVEGTNVAPIDTTDSQVSNIVDQKQIEALPLILRDPYQLVLLTPGTTYTNTGTLGFSVNGGRDRNNNFQLDGTNNNDPGVPGSGLATLNPDATEEFRVISNSYLPEFGRNSSAVIDIITRSGTNNFHGDLYYFGRWNALGARDFFNTPDTGPQSPYVRNTFGISVGGPVIKNKLFYFFNYEGNRFATATTTVATVPDAAFKTGIFTYTDPTAGPVNINVSAPGAPNNIFGLALDPQTQKILNFYPAANGPSVVQGVSSQLFFADTDLVNANNYLGRVDYTISPRNTVSVRYLANKSSDNGGNTNVLPGIGGAAATGLTQSLNGHLSSTISPTLQNDFYAGATRSFQNFTCNGASTIDSLSLAGVDSFGRGRDFPLPGFTPVACFALGDSDGQDRPFGTYNIGDNMTWTKGRHTIKFGYEFGDNYSNNFDNFGTRSTPNFAVFTNTTTSALKNTVPFSNPTVEDAVWGLLGGVFSESQTQLFNTTGTRVSSDERGFRERDMSGFFQDQFKLKSNFTLNFGMRYEWDGVPWVIRDQLTSATPEALAGPAPITFVQVTRGGSNPLYVNDTKGFEPRIGFAWDPFKDGKTSIRGGFGYFRDRQFFNLTGDTRANPPFSLPFVNSVFNGGIATAADQISNIPIPVTQPAPGFSLPQFAQAFPATIDPNFRVPYVQQRNLGIQRELGGHFVLEVNYVGSKANRLLRVIDGNPPIPALVSKLRAFCSVPNPNQCVDSPTAPNGGPNGETVQGIFLYLGADAINPATGLPFLPFDAVNNSAALHANEVASIAQSNYNALQTTITRQFAHGMSFQANYTWAHAIDDASDAFQPQQNQTVFPANSNELKREKGNSSFDVRNRAVINYIAELPFGRGKARLNSGFVGRVLEGWSWSGIATLQSGFPFEIFAPGIDSDATGATQRASFSTTPTIDPVLSRTTQTGPNVGLFTFPLFGGPGNVHRNSFYGPSYKNFDMVIAKNTKITERFTVEFRSEYYNVFNHPNFQQPDNFITDGALFGQSSAEVGRNDSTTGARQLQFGMKLHF
jgi:Carboxypeptidase regulatory-like domain/TonB-dependent Receptor Plug Domain